VHYTIASLFGKQIMALTIVPLCKDKYN